MVFSKIEKAAYDIANPAANELGYEIYDVVYIKEGPYLFLRIFVNSPDGVNLDDCEDISRRISGKLDEIDIIENNYFLEVSSPGIERVLRQDEHFSSAVDEIVHVKLFGAVDGAKEHEGVLVSADADNIILKTEVSKVLIPKKNIAKANVVFEF